MPDHGHPVGMLAVNGLGEHPPREPRRIVQPLAELLQDDLALAVELLLGDRRAADERDEPAQDLPVAGRGHGDMVDRLLERRVPVVDAARGADEEVEPAAGLADRALENHVLYKMADAGAGMPALGRRAGADPELDRHHPRRRRAPDGEARPVRQHLDGEVARARRHDARPRALRSPGPLLALVLYGERDGRVSKECGGECEVAYPNHRSPSGVEPADPMDAEAPAQCQPVRHLPTSSAACDGPRQGRASAGGCEGSVARSGAPRRGRTGGA